MALQQTLLLNNGLTATNAYCRIDAVSAAHNQQQGDVQYISVMCYASHQAYQDGKGTIEHWVFDRQYDDTASVTMGQLYTWLKTLLEFETATDV